jgi:hypothetical protein
MSTLFIYNECQKMIMHAKSSYLLQFCLITLAYNEPSTNQHRFTCCTRSSSWWHWKLYLNFLLFYKFITYFFKALKDTTTIWTNMDLEYFLQLDYHTIMLLFIPNLPSICMRIFTSTFKTIDNRIRH